MRRHLILASASLLLLGLSAVAQSGGAVPMNDAALDSVSASGVSAQVVDGIVHFNGRNDTPTRRVEGIGTIEFHTTGNGTTNGNLVLSDNAQSNLRSLVNINAVNSPVNVLLNLTINIDSVIGTLTQSNLNGVP